MVRRALQCSPISVEQWHGMGMQPLVSTLVEPGLRIIPLVELLVQIQLLVQTLAVLCGQT